MGAYLVSFVLLLVMVALIARPFLTEPVAAAAPAGALDRDSHEVVPATVARAATAPVAAAAAAPVDAEAEATSDAVTADAEPLDAAPAAEPAPSSDDALRAQVEAAIAARKVALSTAPCTSCGATIERTDAFCRTCGSAQAADAS